MDYITPNEFNDLIDDIENESSVSCSSREFSKYASYEHLQQSKQKVRTAYLALYNNLFDRYELPTPKNSSGKIEITASVSDEEREKIKKVLDRCECRFELKIISCEEKDK
jgi:hypothetical protein